uniref:Synaptogyrin 3 n=1 Tax=Rousettus aegyptiacus TaxID=9407 RepID=A0A7J8F434_ROUAE|nr:synaptogyrin 3 [Rousettus aegyptiacus]
MEGASFGAGRAGAALDPVSFARRPQTLLRVVSWVFSIAVFGPIVNEGYVNSDSGPELRCVFNGNTGACRFGVALGLGAFLACAAFLLLDVRFQQISSGSSCPSIARCRGSSHPHAVAQGVWPLFPSHVPMGSGSPCSCHDGSPCRGMCSFPLTCH